MRQALQSKTARGRDHGLYAEPYCGAPRDSGRPQLSATAKPNADPREIERRHTARRGHHLTPQRVSRRLHLDRRDTGSEQYLIAVVAVDRADRPVPRKQLMIAASRFGAANSPSLNVIAGAPTGSIVRSDRDPSRGEHLVTPR